jgi:hypothetical protein
MATANTEDFSDLHERVLGFMGAFSSTQFAIDSVIGLYLQRRMPDLGFRVAEAVPPQDPGRSALASLQGVRCRSPL